MARRPHRTSRGFWTRVFSGVDVPDDAARQLRSVEDEPLDAAWLADTIGSADVRQRAERLEQIAFGQRVFGDVAAAGRDRADVFVALRGMSRYRLLILTLDRIGIRSPSVFARGRQARAAPRHPSTAGAASWPRRSFRARSRSCRAWRGSARSAFRKPRR